MIGFSKVLRKQDKEAGIRHPESKPIQTILCFWTSALTGLAIMQDYHLNKQNLEQVVLKAFEWALESQYYNSKRQQIRQNKIITDSLNRN